MTEKYPKKKLTLMISVIETEENRHGVRFDFEEEDATMTDVSLLIYEMKRFEQRLIDKEWNTDDNYEIEQNDID